MKHKVKLAVLSAMLCANAIADPVYLPPGPNLTYGSSSNNQSIMSSVANPAAAAAELNREDSQYRAGILSIGAGFEVGKVDGLFNLIDSTKNTITTPITNTQLQTLYTTDCPTLTCTPTQQATFATDIANAVNNSAAVATINNSVLPALQQDGKASVFVGGHVPLTPLVVSKKNWGGSFVLDANISAIANMSFIADPLFLSNATATTIATAYAANPATFTMPTIPNDSTLLVKAAVVQEVSFGYSRPVLSRETGDLTAGVRAKAYQVKLARNAQKLITSTGAQNTLNASQTYTSSSGIGLDVGTLWTAKRYRVGAWVNNLNKPSFKYNAIDPAVLATYDATKGVLSQLVAETTYDMKPQVQLEGAYYSESQNWIVNAGLDGNTIQDAVGRDFKWMTLSAAYATDSWWIPGARVGYRANMAGSKLRYATAGLTLFKALSLDVAYGLDSVTDNNGRTIPRSAMINLGLQMTF
ncbi:MAG: conjugal transfer protein TraF [Nitrosomonadales bacterium]|nr:conjugal transfer protein TraF [Nitrosomonadales bacterium]